MQIDLGLAAAGDAVQQPWTGCWLRGPRCEGWVGLGGSARGEGCPVRGRGCGGRGRRGLGGCCGGRRGRGRSVWSRALPCAQFSQHSLLFGVQFGGGGRCVVSVIQRGREVFQPRNGVLTAACGRWGAQQLGQIAHGQVGQAAVVIAGHETKKGQPFGGRGGQILTYCLDGLDVLGFQSGRQGAGVVALQGQPRASSLAPGHGHPVARRLWPLGRTAIAEATGQRPVDQDLEIGSRHGRRSDVKGGQVARRAGQGWHGVRSFSVDIVPQGGNPDGAGLHVEAFSRVSAGVAMRRRPGFRGLSPQYGVGLMACIGISTSRSGVFMKWFERMLCN